MIPLAKLTWQSVLSRRLVVLILVVGFLLAAATRLFLTLSLGQDTRLATDFYLTAVPVATIVSGITISAYQFLIERERGVLLLILAQPLGDAAFVIGKFLGLAAAVSGIYWLLALEIGLLVSPGLTLPWAAILLALLVSWLEVMLLVAIAVLLAAVTAPVLATVLTIAVWLTGHLLDILLAAATAAGGTVALFGRAVYLLFPNLDKFNLHERLPAATTLPADYYGWTFIYALAYTGLAVLLAVWSFRRRDW